MTTPEARDALAMAQRLHSAQPVLDGFVSFPSHLLDQHVPAQSLPVSDTFQADRTIGGSGLHAEFIAALRAFAPQAMWRQTYKDTYLGAEFREKFGCYELIGKDGPFRADTMRGFIVYMPPGVWYPYHHHPSQELYYVLAGEADFYVRDDCKRLGSGEKAYHASGIAHALDTKDSSILAWVLWRGPNFDVKPEFCAWDAA